MSIIAGVTAHNGIVMTSSIPFDNEAIVKWVDQQLNNKGSYATYEFLVLTCDFYQSELGGGASGEQNRWFQDFKDEHGERN